MIDEKIKFKVSFYAKKNETKEGICPVMGRITIGKRMVQFSTKRTVPLKLWDTTSGRALGKSKVATELNRTLDKINVSINAHYKMLSQKQDIVLPQEVKDAFQGVESGQVMLIKSFVEHNVEFRKRVGVNREHSTAQGYEISCKFAAQFIKHKYNVDDIPIRNLDFSFIEAYDFYLKIELKRKPNTVLEKVRHLRKIIKMAINKGVITKDPFDGYTPERPKAEQKYLTREELEKIMNTPLDHPNRYLTRDVFLFSCFTGMSYRDMCNLTENNIITAEDGVKWIITTRQKTGTPCHIPLLPLPLQIIEKYRGLTKDGKVLLMLSCSRLNKNLKKIAQICGIERRLILHQGRHTYASEITLSQGVPIESVSLMLGHRSLRTTQLYAKITNEKIGEDMSKLQNRIENKYQLNQL